MTWYDDSLAGSVIRRIEAQVIRRHEPWKILEDVEVAVLELVPGVNHGLLLKPIGYELPVEYEEPYYRAQTAALGLT